MCGSFRQPGVAQDRSLSLCGPQRRLSALGDQGARLLRQRRVDVQHEWIDIGAKLGNHERYAMHHEPADEVDIPGKPVELRNRDRAFAFSRRVERASQLRPELERVRPLAGLDFGEFSDDLEGRRYRELCR